MPATFTPMNPMARAVGTHIRGRLEARPIAIKQAASVRSSYLLATGPGMINANRASQIRGGVK